MGEILGLDTVFHLFALGVAVQYGLKNRRWAGVVLAVLSPLVFVFLFMFGPSEQCDFWGTCPTNTTIVVAYLIANVVLASGLMLTATPRHADGETPIVARPPDEHAAETWSELELATNSPKATSNRAGLRLALVVMAVAVLGTLAVIVWQTVSDAPDGPEAIVDDSGAWSTLGVTEPLADCNRRWSTVTFSETDAFVVGGMANSDTGCDAYRFSFEDETWHRLSRQEAPELARLQHVAAWTGSEMILWGGFHGDSGVALDAGAYDPTSDTWRFISEMGQPDPRNREYAAVWTGSEMLVWGGPDRFGAYDPHLDRWRSLSNEEAPPVYGLPAAIAWTGSEMAIWGGWTLEDPDPEPPTWPVKPTDSGGVFDPASGRWILLDGGQPGARVTSCMATVGDSLVVWGGADDGNQSMDDGGAYDLTTSEWRQFTSRDALVERHDFTCGSTGDLFFIVGGIRKVSGGKSPMYETFTDGALFDPAMNHWYRIPAFDELGPFGTFVRKVHGYWDGERIVVVVAHQDGRLGAYAYEPEASMRRTDQTATSQSVETVTSTTPPSQTVPSTTMPEQSTTSTTVEGTVSPEATEDMVNAAVAVALVNARRFDEGVTFCGHRLRGFEVEGSTVVAYVDGTCEAYDVVDGIVELGQGQGIGARIHLEWRNGDLVALATEFGSENEEDPALVFPEYMKPTAPNQASYPDAPLLQAATYFGAVEELTLGSDATCQDVVDFRYRDYGHAVAYWMREGRPSRLDPDSNSRPCEDFFTTDEVAWYFETPLRSLNSDLYCRDIAAMGLGYGVAVAYWITVGTPDRMDADRNSIPCETVYPPEEVAAFLKPARTYESGLSCSDLAADGAQWPVAVAYWISQGAPTLMDPDGDGIPCQTAYPDWWATRLIDSSRQTMIALESGLLCRDLHQDAWSYQEAVRYWLQEGSPHRMDTDRNGIPCETIYPQHRIDKWLKFDRIFRVD